MGPNDELLDVANVVHLRSVLREVAGPLENGDDVGVEHRDCLFVPMSGRRRGRPGGEMYAGATNGLENPVWALPAVPLKSMSWTRQLPRARSPGEIHPEPQSRRPPQTRQSRQIGICLSVTATVLPINFTVPERHLPLRSPFFLAYFLSLLPGLSSVPHSIARFTKAVTGHVIERPLLVPPETTYLHGARKP